jgi:hypothetical protein
MKEKNKAIGGVRKVMGNLRFPLDKTYHGCPYLVKELQGVARGTLLFIFLIHSIDK